MIKTTLFEKYLPKSELGVGLFLALLIGYLHYLFMQYAGGLWRDETSTFNIATQPSIVDGFQLMPLESFPGFFYLLLRAWHEVGFTTPDSGIRFFGMLVGLSLVAACWITGRALGYRIPFFSSVLIGLSPIAIKTSDSIRAYGLGMILIILTLGLVWNTLQKPSVKNSIFTAIIALLSVHTLYQNAFLLFAICLGALAVTIRHRLWHRARTIVVIGAISALSLVVYAQTIQQMHQFQELYVTQGFTVERLLHVFSSALNANTAFMLWVWLALILIGVFIATRKQFTLNKKVEMMGPQDLQLFALVTLVTSVLSFICFLNIIDLQTHEWYYIPLMSLIAVLLDVLFATFIQSSAWRTVRLATVLTLAVYLFFNAIPDVKMRQTNIDIIANKLNQSVSKDDFIIVSPWFCATSFARYFHADVAWSTLPPLSDVTVQRVDLFKTQMQTPNAIAPILAKMTETLQAGNRVWVVGNMQSLPHGQVPPPLPPAPHSQWGWQQDAYSAIWQMQTAYFIEQNARIAQSITLPTNQGVSSFENLPLVLITGWRN
jgi:hypothetical protein